MPSPSYGSMATAVGEGAKAPPPIVTSAPPLPKTTTVDEEVDAIGFGRFHTYALCILGLANASDAVELLCISFILPRLPQDSFNDTDKSLLSSAIFVGMLIGGLVFGVASDIFGRRTALVASLLINAFFGLLSSIVPETPHGLLLTMRVLGGFGVGGSIPGVFTMAAEVLPTRRRGFHLTLVAWWWMVGSIYTAACAWLVIGTLGLSWRYFAALCALPAFAAALLVALVLPESPRYLVLCGRVDAAERALIYIAGLCRTESRLSRGFRLDAGLGLGGDSEGLRALDKESSEGAEGGAGADDPWSGSRASTASSTSASTPQTSASADNAANVAAAARKAAFGGGAGGGGGSGSESDRISLVGRSNFGGEIGLVCGARPTSRLALLWDRAMQPVREFFSPQLRNTSLLLMAVWFCLSLGWYGLTLWIPTIFEESNVELDEYQDSFLVQAANLPGNVISTLLIDRIGRKGVLSVSLAVACVAAIAFPFGKVEWQVVLLACLLNAASTCSWNALDCLSTESFPTELRATSMGLLAATGRLGSIAGQFLFGALIHVSLFALLGVAGTVLLLGAVAGALLPRDPKDFALEEKLQR